jgi:iron(II)-dependent oxidoreductase
MVTFTAALGGTACTGDESRGAAVSRTPTLLEVAALRQLAIAGDDERLAAALDRAMVEIPTSRAPMGSDGEHADEAPVREVTVSAFAIDRYEVTNAQYRRYVLAGGRAPVYWDGTEYPSGTADHPVVGVSWRDADGYCTWAGKRLPTEAEWERACRGEDGRIYPWGDEWRGDAANVTVLVMPDRDDAWPLLAAGSNPGGAFPEPVGNRLAAAGPSGVCDLAGNVAEWLADYYHPRAYSILPDADPMAINPPWEHVVRGSAWLYPHDRPDLLPDLSRCALRKRSHVADDPRIGFRCARSIDQP